VFRGRKVQVTRLQRDRDAAVREDGERRHERITG
jgi:hypothetical protein